MCEKNGIPHLFLTVTADEVSELKWESVRDMEAIIQSILRGSTFQDAPVECTRLFHARFMRFFKEWISVNQGKGKGCFGRVTDYVIRYEVQDRGSVHAHVVLWIHPDDQQAAYSNIVACMPAEWDETAEMSDATMRQQVDAEGTGGAEEEGNHRGQPAAAATRARPRGEWRVPIGPDPLHRRLFMVVRRKQPHICRKIEAVGSCRKDRELYLRTLVCQNGFPQKVQLSREPLLDSVTGRYTYYCPHPSHRNVVPYCPAIALVWNAHHNVQRIVQTTWSFYLMKYAMKVGFFILHEGRHSLLRV